MKKTKSFKEIKTNKLSTLSKSAASSSLMTERVMKTRVKFILLSQITIGIVLPVDLLVKYMNKKEIISIPIYTSDSMLRMKTHKPEEIMMELEKLDMDGKDTPRVKVKVEYAPIGFGRLEVLVTMVMLDSLPNIFEDDELKTRGLVEYNTASLVEDHGSFEFVTKLMFVPLQKRFVVDEPYFFSDISLRQLMPKMDSPLMRRARGELD